MEFYKVFIFRASFFIRLLKMVTLYLFKMQWMKIILMLFMKMEFWMFEAQIKKTLWPVSKALRKIFFKLPYVK